MAKKKVSDALMEAAHLIDAGWCKGRMSRTTRAGNQHYCALGALMAATNHDDRYEVAKEYLKLFTEDQVSTSFYAITSYNDAQERKKLEVIDLFLHAAAYAKTKGN